MSTTYCHLTDFSVTTIINGATFCCVYFALRLDLVCWTPTNDVHGFTDISHNFATLEECQVACIDMKTCVAVDWQPTNAQGETCWILTSKNTRSTTERGVVVHYEIHRYCSG